MSRPNLLFIAALAAYTVSMRLMPYFLNLVGVEIEPPTTFYPWNFSPMSAFCLFGAAYLAQKWWAYLLPVGVLLAGDLGIWALTGKIEWAFHKNMATVYLSFLLMSALGMRLREKRTLSTVWMTGLVGETLFFLLTNLGVWYFSTTYSLDAKGLLDCYIFALPFFGRSLLSTFVFSTLIFRPYILRERQAAETLLAESPKVAV